MKLKSILLFEQTFAQWFNGSVVVDKNKKPLKLYHGTPIRFNLKTIKPLSHFGPVETTRFFGINGKAYEAFLNLKSPLRVSDFDGFHTPIIFLHSISESEFAPKQMKTDAETMIKGIDKFNPMVILHDFILNHKIMSEEELWNTNYDDELKAIEKWHLANNQSYQDFKTNLISAADRCPSTNTITNMVVKLMQKYNFDGFVYTNYAEANGKDCYVILNSSQCWWINLNS